MNKPLKKAALPFTLTLGGARQVDAAAPRVLFQCRKDGLAFLGQLTFMDSRPEDAAVEMFSGNFIELLPAPRREDIWRDLKKRLLELIVDAAPLPERLRARALAVLERAAAAPPLARGPEGGGPGLQAIFDRFNRDFFGGGIQAAIRWGRERPAGGRRNSLRFGYYHARRRLITVNPVLRREFVPRMVLELTVFHEMCHEYAPPVRAQGCWRAHHAAFKRKEKEYPHYREAREWEKRNLPQLLRA